MEKTLLIAALVACGFSALAQTPEQTPAQVAKQPAQPQQVEAQKPLKILLLKKGAGAVAKVKVNDAEEGRQVPLKRAVSPAADQVTAEGALKLPITPAAHPAPVVAKVRAQTLPGIGTMPGDVADMRIKSVPVGTDRNELVYISQGQLNKISTPFDSPQAIDATGATLKAVGQDVYLQPSSDKPLTVYITNGGVGQSIGLTLVPKANLPAQTIVLQPDSSAGSPATKAEAEEIVAGDYVSRINSLVKQLALGKTPAGFTRSRLPRSVVAGSGLAIEPQNKYAGATYDLFSYKVRSTSTAPLELKEDAFYTDAVRAVAFFPSAMLQTGEETTVFVIADRPVKEAAQ